MNKPWRDVSRPTVPGMPVWPGDPAVEALPIARITEGAPSNVTHFRLSSHTGTHVDPPLHFVVDGPGVDALELDVLCGPCQVLDFSDLARHISAEDLRERVKSGSRRLLFKTRNSHNDPTVFNEDYIALTPDAADWLVEQRMQLVGVDGPSIEAYTSIDFRVHHTILGAGIVVVEGLMLAGVEEGVYDLICLPMKWGGADGAPARVILRRSEMDGDV